MVSNLASSLLSSAKSALGISSPSRLFADEVGAWIAPGLAAGIASTAHVATTAATQLAQSVTSAAGIGGNQGLRVSGTGLAVGAGGGGGVNIQLNVAGHVWTTQDLVREMQTQLLQHGTRNSSSGINYAYA
jgi:hypothetical protein